MTRWIHLIRAAVRAAPSEGADRGHAFRAVAIHGFKSQAEAQAGGRVQRGDLIGGHQRYRARRENPHAVQLAASADHLEESRVIVRRGGESRAARKTFPRTIDVRALK